MEGFLKKPKEEESTKKPEAELVRFQKARQNTGFSIAKYRRTKTRPMFERLVLSPKDIAFLVRKRAARLEGQPV
ncbi:hypothetical protein [Allobaculum fili]|uniref:hypothetical protein n=1 Tax=Allobaculum fili TaxID=2834460 RepID=UPI001E61C6F6|nr:hypothetical protein [Allobaculum fili]